MATKKVHHATREPSQVRELQLWIERFYFREFQSRERIESFMDWHQQQPRHQGALLRRAAGLPVVPGREAVAGRAVQLAGDVEHPVVGDRR